MKEIEHLLQERIGLDSASVGPALIQRAVRLRMKLLGVKLIDDYRQLLSSSGAEWKELVEAVVVTETWFFRDKEPLAAFARLMLKEWLPAQSRRVARVLSLPCSSGEEPYSLAMALLDAGVPAARFRLEGVDISERALAHAKRGIYGKNSFRGKDLNFRKRHFQPAKDGFVVGSAIRHCVRFSQGNLLSADFRAGKESCDFIFCHNLLIYFDRNAQRRALDRLARLLAPWGILFVGPAEQQLVLDCGFVSAGISMAFACRKESPPGAPAAHRLRAASLLKLPSASHPFQFNVQREPPLSLAGGPEPQLADNSGHPLLETLETARRLADAGRLREAAGICEAHLREGGPSAHAYYLLGLVREADGKPGAIECYRKALYLEPDHYDTLMQMALLSQKNGESARARTFKSRAQRVKAKE